MLLQLENTDDEDINKLLAFAKLNLLKLSFIDESESRHLPGKPLTEQQINRMIEQSRESGIIAMKQAHQVIRSNYNAG